MRIGFAAPPGWAVGSVGRCARSRSTAAASAAYGDDGYGTAGKDTIWGGNGADFLYGGDSADVLWGAAEEDCYDGRGNVAHVADGERDTIIGGGGADFMSETVLDRRAYSSMYWKHAVREDTVIRDEDDKAMQAAFEALKAVHYALEVATAKS